MLTAPLILFSFVSATATSPSKPSAVAQEETSPYELDLVTDSVLTVGATSIALLLNTMVQPSMRVGPACAGTNGKCQRGDLNALDRQFIDVQGAGAQRASDGLAIATLLVPPIAAYIDSSISGSASPFADTVVDTWVLVESIALATLVSDVIKLAARRPRPSNYRDDANPESLDEQLSFPSGHTTWVTTAATSYASSFWYRHPTSPWRYVVAAAAAATSVFVGVERVAAGKHFPTDVLAGALIGSSFGLLVPRLHLRDSSSDTLALVPVVDGGNGASLSLVATF